MLCPGHVRSLHDALSHVPGPFWIDWFNFSNQRWGIPRALGPRTFATCWLLVGYLRFPVVCRDRKTIRQTLAGSSEIVLGRAGANLELTWGELEPTWGGSTWANLSQLGTSLERTWSIFLQTWANLGPSWARKTLKKQWFSLIFVYSSYVSQNAARRPLGTKLSLIWSVLVPTSPDYHPQNYHPTPSPKNKKKNYKIPLWFLWFWQGFLWFSWFGADFVIDMILGRILMI